MAKYSAGWIAVYSLIAGCGSLLALYLYSNNNFEMRARHLGLINGYTEEKILNIIKYGQDKNKTKNEDSISTYSSSESIDSVNTDGSFESFESFDSVKGGSKRSKISKRKRRKNVKSLKNK